MRINLVDGDAVMMVEVYDHANDIKHSDVIIYQGIYYLRQAGPSIAMPAFKKVQVQDITPYSNVVWAPDNGQKAQS